MTLATAPKDALITGVTGQDGAYLAELPRGLWPVRVQRHPLQPLSPLRGETFVANKSCQRLELEDLPRKANTGGCSIDTKAGIASAALADTGMHVWRL